MCVFFTVIVGIHTVPTDVVKVVWTDNKTVTRTSLQLNEVKAFDSVEYVC